MHKQLLAALCGLETAKEVLLDLGSADGDGEKGLKLRKQVEVALGGVEAAEQVLLRWDPRPDGGPIGRARTRAAR